jgi:hypothetical protein
MGPLVLDITNGFNGDFYLLRGETGRFSEWCRSEGLPDPFIGWVSGDNSGDQCDLGPDNEHTRLAREWCRALEEKQPEMAKLGYALLKGADITDLLFPGEGPIYPDRYLSALSGSAWDRCKVAKWYAILKNGIEHGDTLVYC